MRVLRVGLMLLLGAAGAAAQDVAAALGPGTYIQVGGGYSSFQGDYGRTRLGGATFFVDAHLYRRWGLEAEGRLLNIGEDLGGASIDVFDRAEGVDFSAADTALCEAASGARGVYVSVQLRAGVLLCLCAGGGAGVSDCARARRVTLRLVDFEYQRWPQFTYGALHPYGFSSGLAVRVF